MNHPCHLLHLSQYNQLKFKQFAWAPLSSADYWLVEFVISLILLPAISLSVLYYQPLQFNSPVFLPSMIIMIGISGVIWIGLKSTEKTALVRKTI